MCRKALAGCLIVATTVGVRASEDEAGIRHVVEARRLLAAREKNWREEIAGFNRRHAVCDRAEAESTARHDRLRDTTFTRTLGWHWDVASALKVDDAIHGSVKTGAAVETFALNLAKPTTVPGFDVSDRSNDVSEHAGEATPSAGMKARIARSTFLFDRNLEGLTDFVTTFNRSAVCTRTDARKHRARSLLTHHLIWRSRFDPRTAVWQNAEDKDTEVAIEISGVFYTGPIRNRKNRIYVSSGIRKPFTLRTTSFWKQEGNKNLTFTMVVQSDSF